MSAKRNVDYIIDKTDKAINELVFNKWKLQKAYNYYNGKRDPEQFRYLEENFGIGNPTSMEFTPLIKKHVDALVGEYLDIPILPKVSCKDESTISSIHRDLQLEISKKVFNFLKQHLNNQILSFVGGENPSKDLNIQQSIDKLIEEINNDFVSEYEIAAQNVIEYCIQSRSINLANKLRILLLDLLVTGCAFYRVRPSSEGTNIVIETLNPLNTFVDRNPESQYVRDSYRVVIRKWMTKEQILSEYGEELDKDIHDVVIVNFANCDMVGHTGVIPAAIKAVSVVDDCIGEVYEKVLELGGTMLITADHGNAEEELDEEGNPFTAHTTNVVPLIVTNSHLELKEGGKLGDLAPTILQLLGLPVPEEMDGQSLLK